MNKVLMIISLSIFSLTCSPQSGWTIQTLKEHYDYIIKERDQKINQKFESLELAVLKAEQATEKRFEGVNEFRNTLADQQRTFIPRAEVEAILNSIKNNVENNTKKIEAMENLKSGGSNTLFIVIAVVSSFAAILAFSKNFISSVYQKSKSDDLDKNRR